VFSVIIDNYNYADYLRFAIDSVLAQSWRDFELLIVDDGSTDGSKAVVESFRDVRIIPVFKENGGQGSAFYEGLRRAKGDWVAFLDSDDLWHPDKLGRCADVLRQDSGISYLVHNYDEISGEGRQSKRHDLGWPTGYYDPWPDFLGLALRFPFVPTSFFCTPTEFARRVIFDPGQWRICADLPFMGGLPIMGKTYVLDEVLGKYRLHQRNHFAGRNSERERADTYVKLYDCASAQLAALGDSRRVDFRRAAFYQSQEVLSHPLCSLKGIMARIRYRIASLRGLGVESRNQASK
jgi:glycosyltransferase involved in cell wall biosynthesis